MKNKISRRTIYLLIIYLIALIIFNIHIEQYQSYIKEFPDEFSHIGYIAYLEETNRIIPKFEEMQETEQYKSHLKKYKYVDIEKQKDTIETDSTIETENINTRFLENTINHLGHPPLYYHIMKLFNVVKIDNNGNITYNLKKLRNISQIISNIALILTFIFAYRNLKTITANTIFAILLVNIPLLPYVSGATSNDVLSFLGLSIFLLGIDKLTKGKRTYIAYILTATGTFICMLNKVTTGIIVGISYLIILIYILAKDKNNKAIFCKEFLITTPIYVCILVYYILIIARYGTVQPVIQNIAPEYYKTTTFYNDTIYTKAYTIKMYAKNYWNNFINYWAGYNYGKNYPNHELKEGIISLMIFIFPIIYFIHQKIRKSKIDIVNFSVCIGVYVTIIIQFIRQYIEFKTLSGYQGGFHSRYYLCAMPSFLILISRLAKTQNKKIKITSVIVAILYAILMQFMLFQ